MQIDAQLHLRHVDEQLLCCIGEHGDRLSVRQHQHHLS